MDCTLAIVAFLIENPASSSARRTKIGRQSRRLGKCWCVHSYASTANPSLPSLVMATTPIRPPARSTRLHPASTCGISGVSNSSRLASPSLINRRITDTHSLQHLDLRFRAQSDIRARSGRISDRDHTTHGDGFPRDWSLRCKAFSKTTIARFTLSRSSGSPPARLLLPGAKRRQTVVFPPRAARLVNCDDCPDGGRLTPFAFWSGAMLRATRPAPAQRARPLRGRATPRDRPLAEHSLSYEDVEPSRILGQLDWAAACGRMALR